MKKKLQLSENYSDRYEFLPAVLEVLETPPIPFGRIIAISIAAFFMLALLWAVLGTIDVVAVSEGRTMPTGNVKIIQPLEIGVVRAIHIQDGDSVKEGDLLLELDPTESVANLDALSIDLEQARIEAAVGYALLQPDPVSDFKPPSGASAVVVETARNRVEEEHRQHISAVRSTELDIQRLEASWRAVDIERRKLKDTLPLIEDQLKAQEILIKRKMTQKLMVQELQRELIETRAALESTVETGREAKASIEANRSRIEELVASYRGGATQRRGQAMRQIALLEQSILKEQQRLKYLELRAPVDGVVQQLSIHTIGAVVNTAEPLAIIVPKDTLLEVEAMILNKDIGFVGSGQAVEVKLEAFPFTRYGTLTGKLMYVSSDAMIHEKFGPVYKAKVSLDSQQIVIDNKLVNLSPRMMASVEVKQGRDGSSSFSCRRCLGTKTKRFENVELESKYRY